MWSRSKFMTLKNYSKKCWSQVHRKHKVYFSPLADIENGDFKVKVKHDDLETGTIEFAIQKSLRSIMIGTKTFSLHLDLKHFVVARYRSQSKMFGHFKNPKICEFHENCQGSSVFKHTFIKFQNLIGLDITKMVQFLISRKCWILVAKTKKHISRLF